MTLERALLRRLVEWLDGTEGKVAWTGEQTLRDFVLPVTGIAEDARALLAEPEVGTPTLRSMVGAAPDLTGGVESVEWLRRKRAAMEDNYAAYATPRSRAEGSDLSVDQGREFRVVDGLGDSNRAGKVTIDPTLLSPPTPRSRAEAEAMVDRFAEWEWWCHEDRWDDSFQEQRAEARAALLVALTGEGT